MLKHKQPRENIASDFLVNALSENPFNTNFPVLDMPCGFGRNSSFLSELGFYVVSGDYDSDVFKNQWYKNNQLIKPVQFDATKALPFAENSFGAIVVIDFYIPNLFKLLGDFVRPDGLVIYQSYSGRGGNWMELPETNEAKKDLSGKFEFLKYQEKTVGPNKSNVTLKFIAKKIATY